MRYRFPIILLLGLCCLGMGTKKLPLSIRFYALAAQADTSSFSAPVVLLNGQQAYIDQIAVISERDIVAVYPSEVADGSGSCTLKLNEHGTMSLDSLSVDRRGSILIATINGRQVADIMIDKRVSDGIVTIPGGIQVDEMKTILKRYPLMGGAKAKKIEKKKARDIYGQGF